MTSTNELTYATELISLDLFLVPAPKTALVDQLRELLVDEFFDLGDCLLESFLRRAGYMEVQRRVL
jgi:hypothetical protein